MPRFISPPALTDGPAVTLAEATSRTQRDPTSFGCCSAGLAPSFDSLPNSAIIRMSDMRIVLGGVSRVTVWRLRERGLCPVKVTPGVTGWRVGDVRAYLDSLTSAGNKINLVRKAAGRKGGARSVEARRLRREVGAKSAHYRKPLRAETGGE